MNNKSTMQEGCKRPVKRCKKAFAVRGQAGFTLVRVVRPKAKQADGRGKYFPVWYVRIMKPGEAELNTSSSRWIRGGAEICPVCATSDKGPMARAECRCQKPLRRLIENELELAVQALEVTLAEGRVEQYRALMRKPGEGVARATVQDVIDAVEGVRGDGDGVLWQQAPGPEIWAEKTWPAYRQALLRMARLVNAEEPRKVKLTDVLSQRVVDLLQCAAQGVKNRAELNLRDKLDANGGANSTLLNVRSLFSDTAMMRLFNHLDMPSLEEFRAAPYLKRPVTGFVPWDAEVWRQFVVASEKLKETRLELWEVNTWLRRSGLRDAELLKARRSWIEQSSTGPVLVIKDRGVEFSRLKHGKGRMIGIDAELFALVKDLPADEFLVGRGLPKTRRYDLIYRDHNAFVRQFIPDRVKGNHELRMMAGSLVYERYGLQAAADFLGHKSMDTTREFYAAQLTPSAPLTASDVDALG